MRKGGAGGEERESELTSLNRAISEKYEAEILEGSIRDLSFVY